MIQATQLGKVKKIMTRYPVKIGSYKTVHETSSLIDVPPKIKAT
jgi:hypothetical protein